MHHVSQAHRLTDSVQQLSFSTSTWEALKSPVEVHPNSVRSSLQPPNPQLVFIDPGVTGGQTLVDSVSPSIEVIVLDPSKDGIQQISNVLAKRQQISSLHVVSNGEPGRLQLGQTDLTADTLTSDRQAIQNWSKALTADADILLYGCNVAQGEPGEQFMTALSQLTQADVAGSTNLTGSEALGGDWNLEYATGKIESSLPFQTDQLQRYTGVLDTPLINFRNFASLTELKLNGNALQTSNVLRLTPASTSQVGSAFWKTPLAIDANTSFQTRFQFRLQSGNGTNGADGFTFMLQNSPTGIDTLGSDGRALGYGGQNSDGKNYLDRSLAIEFDTYQNQSDLSNNTISVLQDGNTETALATATPNLDLNSGSAINAWVDYNAVSDRLDVYLSQTTVKPTAAALSYTLDLASVLGTQAFVGFSAGTGGLTNAQDIENWELTTFSSDATAPTAQLAAPNVTTGSNSYSFNVTYSDATAVKVSSLDSTDVQVTGSGGFSQLATLVSVDAASDGTPRTATYRITPPGGTWDTADNGSYAVALQANQVSDTSGNLATATALGTFQVNIPTPPPIETLFQDNFNSSTLAPGWKWINEVPADWSLTADPGRLRLKRSTGHGFYKTPATESEQSPVSILYRDGFSLSDGFEIQLKAGFYNYKMFGQVGFVVFTDAPDTTQIDNYFKFIIEYTFDNEVLYVNFLKETNGVDSRVPADLRGLNWGNKLAVDMKMNYVNGRLVSQIREVGASQWQDYFDTPSNLPQGAAVKVGIWAESDHIFPDNGDTEYAWLDDLKITNGKF
jgi:Domain of unknown function (DUF4347)/Legume lectin domain/Beta xylosidase C-terminal Concanavalin A-like domain